MQEQKAQFMQWIKQAVSDGARGHKACGILGISVRTLQRWHNSIDLSDGRSKPNKKPVNALSEFETKLIIQTANKPEYANLSPAKIVPALADTGVYIASESSFYRTLKAVGQLAHRLKSKPKRNISKPRALVASQPNQIYSWDITYLPSAIKGLFFYLYLVMDIYSRKIVGWQVYEQELSTHAADLMIDICTAEGIKREQVTLHSDNGGPMKGATMLATLQKLGIVPSFSRPSVSNDNPYSESLFRTLKYRPEYPNQVFANLHAARNWVNGFVSWYNTEHLHSSIKYVTPQQRHNGEDYDILAKRKIVYLNAKKRNPQRWTGEIRNWNHEKDVFLNPDKQTIEKTVYVAA
jgi:transposase InsO family protein